jgi:hypothetical protein
MKLKNINKISFLFALMLAVPVFANPGKACYSPIELKAEQLLRLHSELMVISYACKRSSQGFDLISVYTAFTQSNLPELQKADQTLLHHYQTTYGGDGLVQLDDLHTRLGNEAGQVIADQSLESFCNNNRDVPVTMYFADHKHIDAEIKRMATWTKSYDALCKVVATKSH